MGFFPHKVKQSLLCAELKREIKEKEKHRTFKQSSNKQKACSHWSQNHFYCRSNESIYWQTISVQPNVNFSVNKLLLGYLQRQIEQYLNTEITHWKTKERSLQNPLSQSVSHSFVLKMYVVYHCTKTYYRQQTETIEYQDNYSTEYYIITWSDIVNLSKRNTKHKTILLQQLCSLENQNYSKN